MAISSQLKNMQKRTFLCLCLFNRVKLTICCFQFILLVRNSKPIFFTINNVCWVFLVELWKHFKQLRSGLYPFLVICKYMQDLSNVLHMYFQNTFQHKCTHNSNKQTSLVILQMVYLPSLLIIPLTFRKLASRVTVKIRLDFAASLTSSMSVRNFFLHHYVYIILIDIFTGYEHEHVSYQFFSSNLIF